MVQDLGRGTGHQTDGAQGHRWGDKLDPIKRRALDGPEALRGAVEIHVLPAAGMGIEARHGGFEGGGGHLLCRCCANSASVWPWGTPATPALSPGGRPANE